MRKEIKTIKIYKLFKLFFKNYYTDFCFRGIIRNFTKRIMQPRSPRITKANFNT